MEEMLAKIQQLKNEAEEVRALCVTEGREPTTEEVDKANANYDEIEKLEVLVATEQRRLDIAARHAEPDPAQKKQEEAAKPQPATKPQHRVVVTPGRQNPNEIFGSLGEQVLAIRNAGIGQRVDPRLYEVRAATGLSESVGADGGFMLQPNFAAMLFEDALQTGKLSSLCRKMTIGGDSNSIKIPAVDETSRATTRHGGTLGYWVDEAGVKTASKPKIRQLELNLNKLVVLCYATDELLQDAGAMEGFIRMSAAHEIGFQIDDAIFQGTGAGRPLGIMNAGCLVTQGKETGQAAATVVYENVVKMWSRLLPGSQPNAVWLINQNVFPQLALMSLSVGTGGGPVWLPAGGASASPYSTLMGRPVMPIEQCATLGTAGDIVLADFQNGYILAEKGGIDSNMSIHVRFLYDESVFRFVLRIDGQPVRASALTPYKGGASYTQSHFVSLIARS
jgi:HK97 family phage major capsid protein